jgi:cytolysin (calcineurin-like family phosphatase)
MRAENVEMNGLDIEKKDIDIERNPWHEKINTASPRKKRGLISTYGNYLLAVGNGSTSEVSSSASSTYDTHEVTNDFGEIPRLLSNEDDVDGTLLDASNIAALNALEEDADAPKSRNHISSSRNQNVRSQIEVLPSLLNELR